MRTIVWKNTYEIEYDEHAHTGMIIVARFHSLPLLIGVTFEKQIIDT